MKNSVYEKLKLFRCLSVIARLCRLPDLLTIVRGSSFLMVANLISAFKFYFVLLRYIYLAMADMDNDNIGKGNISVKRVTQIIVFLSTVP